ncbi:MAG TPA: hypothetical protein VG815_06445 [Chloroflexota bacterium]|jgi:hypothetical protein|nr:hypothetical protein [Chloroflexota bacterium]
MSTAATGREALFTLGRSDITMGQRISARQAGMEQTWWTMR